MKTFLFIPLYLIRDTLTSPRTVNKMSTLTCDDLSSWTTTSVSSQGDIFSPGNLLRLLLRQGEREINSFTVDLLLGATQLFRIRGLDCLSEVCSVDDVNVSRTYPSLT